jgi:two-component system, OmpR family, sensor histidine kinase VanS
LDTKLKNSIFRSFRFEIVLYSLLSLVYTILTEAALAFGIYLVYQILNRDEVNFNVEQSKNIGNNLSYSLNSIDNFATNGIKNQMESSGLQSPGKGLIAVMIIVAIILGMALFTMYFLLLTKKFATYLEDIAEGITKISAGNFDTRIYIKNEDEFAFIATKLNTMADDIKQLIESDRKSEYTKNELITSVAHDLRTPLTSIIGYLELVSDQNKLNSDMRQRYIEIAYNKSKRLEKLIEDLFAYTKFSFGEVTMELSEIDMVKFINQLVDEFYPSFQESGLDYDFSTNLHGVFVVADGNLLARAFANLISNAIKYGKDGKSVNIKLSKEKEKVIVTVTNYGRLIPEKDLQNIFERFYRVEGSRSSETGGTGLGLAIAKSIILMHRGTISVKSDFDGTVFEVVLDEKKEGNDIT